MNNYLKLGDAILFLGENGKVSRRELIELYGRKFVDEVMKSCCGERGIFFRREYPVEGQEDNIRHNSFIQDKIEYLRSVGDYKGIKGLAMQKIPISFEIKYELHNDFRKEVRNNIDQEVRGYEKDKDGYYHFNFSPLEGVYARIGTDIFKYDPDTGMSMNGNDIYYGDKLKEHNKRVIADYKKRMKNYIKLDEEGDYVNYKIDTRKLDEHTVGNVMALEGSDAIVSVRNSRK